MATLDSPTKASISQEVDPTNAAGRSSLRPLEHIGITPNMGGHYLLSQKSGAATVIAAAGAIFSARWTDPAHKCVINKILAAFTPTTGFTAAQAVDVDLVKLTAFSVADSAGTTIALGTSNRKRSAGMGGSLFNDMRIAAAAALTNGTAAVDANVLGLANLYQQFAATNINAVPPVQVLYQHTPGQEHPLILEANEGIRVRVVTTMGAAGVGNFTITIDWAEVPAF
jgi:hypothetical protein